ncbi:MAG: hypothetical protein Q7T86_11875 [Hyphomicrobiaceae bacterium]|nr:hypothetical protein [Hyphomicrobiaceae bacterium]
MTNDARPISPAPVLSSGERELPAYISNGLIGLRVRDIPLLAGMALVSGYAGEHPERRIEACAAAPYPLGGDLSVDGVWLSGSASFVRDCVQSYDFETGELSSQFTFEASSVRIACEVLTFASREDPTLVCQEISVLASAACDLQVKAGIKAASVPGRALRHDRQTPGEPEPCCDGSLLWESAGALGTVGLAYVTSLTGGIASKAERQLPPLSGNSLETTYKFRARAGQRYRLQQITSVICGVMHNQPDYQASRFVAKAKFDSFKTLRDENRAAWAELWKGRIRLVGAEKRWQELADAAFYYLHSSVHPSSPASTSIFGLATWHDYHYYFGHVMWDIEAFSIPVLSLQQPGAADAILDYRVRTLPAARNNAHLMGRRGLQFAWESAPSSGNEAAPLPGTAAWHEDHVSLDVARAFAFHADVCGADDFRRDKAWKVISGAADWIVSRAAKTRRGYEVRASMGIAERKDPVDNAAFTNMACVVVLSDVIASAKLLGRPINPEWEAVFKNMHIPRRGRAVISHDDFRKDEEKGATPDPLMGIWPFGFPIEAEDEAATLALYLDLAEKYIGSPMLSALYGVWAARAGDRKLALKLLDEGYAQFTAGRFSQTLEYRPDRFPEQPMAGPFFANMGGFLMSLLLGFPGMQPDTGETSGWFKKRVVLPEGWRSIEVDRVWVRGEPMRLNAQNGEFATLQPL